MTCVAASKDCSVIVSGRADGKISIWDTGTHKIKHEFACYSAWTLCVDLSQDASLLVCGGENDAKIKVWDLPGKTPEILWEACGHTKDNSVHIVVFSPDLNKIASASEDGVAIIWNAATGEELHRLEHGKGSEATNHCSCVCWSSDCKYVATGGQNGTMYLWDVARGQKVIEPSQENDLDVRSLVFNSNTTLLFSAGDEGVIRMWKTSLESKTCMIQNKWLGHRSPIRRLALSPDEKFLVSVAESGTDDYAVHLWETNTGALVSILHRDELCIRGVLWSRDGKYIVCGGDCKKVFVWSVSEQVRAVCSMLSGCSDRNAYVLSEHRYPHSWHTCAVL